MWKIDGVMLSDFINKNFKSYLEFSREVGISYSHLYYIVKELVLIRDETLTKLGEVLNKYNENIFDYVYPEPLIMNNEKISQIDIFMDDELICSITSRNIIYKDDIKVKCRPY